MEADPEDVTAVAAEDDAAAAAVTVTVAVAGPGEAELQALTKPSALAIMTIPTQVFASHRVDILLCEDQAIFSPLT